MKQSQRNELIVGAFVLVAGAALFGLTFIIQGSTGMNPYVVNVEFANVSGLEIGSPVLVQGFRTGRVAEMLPGRKDTGEATVVVVTKIARTIPIYKNAKVSLVQQGFIGDKRLEIDPGTEDAGEVVDGETLGSIPPTDLTELFKKGERMMEDLRVTLANVRQITSDQERLKKIDTAIANISDSTTELKSIIEENRENVRLAVSNVQDLSAKGNRIAERADQLLGNADEAMAEFRKSTQDLTKKVDSLLAQADGVGTNANDLLVSSREQVEDVSESLQTTSDSLNKLISELNQGKGTVGMLLKDPRPFEDLQESISAVRKMLLEEQNDLYDHRLPYRGKTGAVAGKEPVGASADGVQ